MLKDLEKITRKVEVRGQDYEITALSMKQLKALTERFPEYGRRNSGNTLETDDPFETDVRAATIAMAFGKSGDVEFEEYLKDNLTGGEAAYVYATIMDITSAATNYPSEPPVQAGGKSKP